MKSCTLLQHRSLRILVLKSVRLCVSMFVGLCMLISFSQISVFRDLMLRDVHAVDSPAGANTIVNIAQEPKEHYIVGDMVTVNFTFAEAYSANTYMFADIYVFNEFGYYSKIVNLRSVDGYTWSFNYRVTNETEPGNYDIRRIGTFENGIWLEYQSSEYYLESDLDLSLASFTVFGTSGDHEPPVLNSFTVSSQEVAALDMIEFDLDISDPSQPVGMEIYYRMGESSKEKLVTVCYQSNVKCEYTVETYDPSGLWQVAYVVLFDDAMQQNRVTIYNEVLYPNAEVTMNFESASFNVIGTQTDLTAPELRNVLLSSQRFHLNETLYFEIDAIDDVSGCSNFRITFVNRDTGYTYSMMTNGSTLKGEYNFLQSNAEAGSYSIQQIEAKDLAQNVKVYYNQALFSSDSIGVGNELFDFSVYDFEVLETSISDVSEWITNVTASQTEVTFGQDVLFSFQATGELAQADKVRIVYDQGYSDAPADEFEHNQYLELYNQGDGYFLGNYRYIIEISGYYRPMVLKYWIDGVEKRIYDAQNIEGLLVSDLSGFGLTIKSQTNEDVTPPILDFFTIDMHEPQIFDTVPFNIQGHDDESGINRYVVFFRVNGEQVNESVYLYVNENGEESNFGRFISEYERNGLWEVDYVHVESHSSSVLYYNPKFYPNETNILDFSSAYFTIQGAIEDHVAPTLDGIELNTNAVYPNDVIEFSASLHDDVAGIGYVYIDYRNENDEFMSVFLDQSDLTTAFGTFTIPLYTRPGVWKVSAVYLSDKAGNQSMYVNTKAYFNICDNYDMARCSDLTYLDFEVLGDLSDTEGPQLDMLASDFKTYINRGSANIVVEVHDANQVKEIKFEYSTPFGIRNYYAAMYSQNETTYEVSIPIPTYNSLGKWMLTRVFLTDIYGNRTTYIDSPFVDVDQHRLPLDNGDFVVIGKEMVPTVSTIDTNIDLATQGETVEINLDLNDDIIKPDTIEAKLSNYDLSSRTISLIKQTDGTYLGFFGIGEYTSNGIWFVESLFYTDRYGVPFEINNIAWNPNGNNPQDLNSADFEVYGTQSDIEAPEVTDVSIENASQSGLMKIGSHKFATQILRSPYQITELSSVTSGVRVFNAGETIKFLVKANDAISGLDSLYVTYHIFRKEISFAIDMSLNAEGSYEGEVQIQDYYPQGNWSLAYFEASDAAGNKFIQTKEEIETTGFQIGLNQLNFVVNNPNEDKTNPVLTDLFLNSHHFKEGETLVLTAHAFDSHAGISSFEITLMPYDYSETSLFKKITMLQMDDGSYQGELEITGNIVGGLWGIKDIIIQDRASNQFEQHNLYMYPGYITNKKVMSEYDVSIDRIIRAEIQSLPNKLTYRLGESIDLTGIKVLGYTMDGLTREVEIRMDMLYNFDTSNEIDEQIVYVFIDETYVSFAINVINQTDTTPPVITLSDYDKGWTNESFCVYATVNEGSLNVSEHCFHDNGSFEFVATDEAGNESRQSVVIDNIDKTLPTIYVSQNLKFTLNSISSIPYLAFDFVSGLVGEGSGSINLDTSNIGNYTVSISVMDQAGNQRVEEVSYQIVYDFLGFQQPINTNGTSIFKAGSTIPIKFKLIDAMRINQGDAIASLKVTQLSNNVDGVVNELPISISASSSEYFRYDDLSGQYILNLSTKAYPAGKYRFTVNMSDGTNHSIEIGLKK